MGAVGDALDLMWVLVLIAGLTYALVVIFAFVVDAYWGEFHLLKFVLIDPALWLLRQVCAAWRGEEREPFVLTVGGALLVIAGGMIVAFGLGSFLLLGVTPPIAGVFVGVVGAVVCGCGFYLLDKRLRRAP